MGFVSSEARRRRSKTRRRSPGADRGFWTGRGRGRGYCGNLYFPIFSFLCFSSFFLLYWPVCILQRERSKKGGRFFTVRFPRRFLQAGASRAARAMAGESLPRNLPLRSTCTVTQQNSTGSRFLLVLFFWSSRGKQECGLRNPHLARISLCAGKELVLKRRGRVIRS